jgi:uncharacterized membrane protein YcgQ (UPF0703/DUF1980 family)
MKTDSSLSSFVQAAQGLGPQTQWFSPQVSIYRGPLQYTRKKQKKQDKHRAPPPAYLPASEPYMLAPQIAPNDIKK